MTANNTPQQIDQHHMRAAIALAERCTSAPYFAVGALIVDLKNQVISTGFTNEREGLHAEEVAIAKAHEQHHSMSGATIYSSLEPCSVRLSGKRSCSDRIIESGIQRVVFGAREPDDFVKCEGVSRLKDTGVTVVELADFAAECLRVGRSKRA